MHVCVFVRVCVCVCVCLCVCVWGWVGVIVYLFAFKFLENKDNSSKIWTEIRSLVNLKPTKSSTIKILDENENLTSDSEKIANIFNEHCATLGSKVQQKIPTQEGDYKFYLDKRDKNGRRYINPDGCTFYLSPAGPAEVEKIIDEINVKKSTGPFGIPIFLLKKFKNFFSRWLCEFVNLSFETGMFPDVLKVAKVNPLHKKDSKIDHRNYTPISLSAKFSKSQFIKESISILIRKNLFIPNNLVSVEIIPQITL